MIDNSPRKHFQFHLSTAIVMMFAAGGLIWANVRPVIVSVHARAYGITIDSTPGTEVSVKFIQPGFPLFTNRYRSFIAYNLSIEEIASRIKEFKENRFELQFLFPNIVASALILVLVWFLCEWLIGRSSARKELGNATREEFRTRP